MKQPWQVLYFALTFPYPLGRVYRHLQATIERCVHNGVYAFALEHSDIFGCFRLR